MHGYGQTARPAHAFAPQATHGGHAPTAHPHRPPTSDHPPASVARSDPPPSAAWHQNLGGAAPAQRPGPQATGGSGQYPPVPAVGIPTGSGQYPPVSPAGITTGTGHYPPVSPVGITTGTGQPSPFVTTNSGQISPVAPQTAPRKKSALPLLAIAGGGLLLLTLTVGGLFVAFSGDESNAASAPAKDGSDVIAPTIPTGARPAVAQPKKPIATQPGTTAPVLAPTSGATAAPASEGAAPPATPSATGAPTTTAPPAATPPRDTPPPAGTPPRPTNKGNDKEKGKGPKDK
jgi:hypothetical protein